VTCCQDDPLAAYHFRIVAIAVLVHAEKKNTGQEATVPAPAFPSFVAARTNSHCACGAVVALQSNCYSRETVGRAVEEEVVVAAADSMLVVDTSLYQQGVPHGPRHRGPQQTASKWEP
jgi:hypothetical protein